MKCDELIISNHIHRTKLNAFTKEMFKWESYLATEKNSSSQTLHKISYFFWTRTSNKRTHRDTLNECKSKLCAAHSTYKYYTYICIYIIHIYLANSFTFSSLVSHCSHFPFEYIWTPKNNNWIKKRRMCRTFQLRWNSNIYVNVEWYSKFKYDNNGKREGIEVTVDIYVLLHA